MSVSGAALMLGGLTVGAAQPARAATIELTVDCTDEGSGIDGLVNVVAAPGDTIVVNGDEYCIYAFTNAEVFSAVPSGGPPYVWVIDPAVAPGTYGDESPGAINAAFGVDNDDPGVCSGVRADFCGSWFSLTIVDPGAKDLTVWQKQVGRASADAACADGYSPSWAQWPNDGAGGWVCTRDTLAYYPDEPVS